MKNSLSSTAAMKSALIASILIHLAILTLLVSFCKQTDEVSLQHPFSVLHFAFVPEKTSDTHSDSPVSSPARSLPSSGSPSFSRPSEISTKPPDAGEKSGSSGEPGKQRRGHRKILIAGQEPVSETSGEINAGSPVYLKPEPSIPPRFSFNNNVPARIYPATFPLSPNQEKMIRKKVERLASRVNEKTFVDSTLQWRFKGQEYQANLVYQPAGTATALDVLLFVIRTRQNGHTLYTKIRLKRLAFSSFAHFVDYWDPAVAAHDDEITGRFHTNTDFAISTSYGTGPKFYGRVTLAGHEIRTAGEFPIFDYAAIFPKGVETDVNVIPLPNEISPLPPTAAGESEQIHILDRETWITFRSSHSYSWKTAGNPCAEHPLPEEIPFYILGGKHARLHLKGIVTGKVLVFSENHIIIEGDLLYAHNPEISESNDFLGIVSLKNVEIARPEITGPGDLIIQAAIYAKRKFKIPYRYPHKKAILYIYGSLSAGSISATEPRYATRVIFDKRLQKLRPPRFPFTEQYEITEWNKKWTVDSSESRAPEQMN